MHGRANRSRLLHRQVPPLVRPIIGTGHMVAHVDFSQGLKAMVGAPGKLQYGSYMFGDGRNMPQPGNSAILINDEIGNDIAHKDLQWWSSARQGTTNHNINRRGDPVYGLKNVDAGEASVAPTFDTIAAHPDWPELQIYRQSSDGLALEMLTAIMSGRVKALQYIGAPPIVSNGSGHTPNSTFIGTMAGGTVNNTGRASGDNTTTLLCAVDGAGNVSFPNTPGVGYAQSPYATIARYSAYPSGTVAVTGGTGTGLTVTAPYIAGLSDIITGRISTSRYTFRSSYREVCGQCSAQNAQQLAAWLQATGNGVTQEYDVPEIPIWLQHLLSTQSEYHQHPTGSSGDGPQTNVDASTNYPVWGLDHWDRGADVYFAPSDTAARTKVTTLYYGANELNYRKELILENAVTTAAGWGGTIDPAFVSATTRFRWATWYRSARHRGH